MEYTATRSTQTPKLPGWNETPVNLPERHPGDSWWLCFRSNVDYKKDAETGEDIWFEAAAPGLSRKSVTYYRAGEVYALTDMQVPKKYRKVQKMDEKDNPVFVPDPRNPNPGARWIEEWEYTDPDPLTGERKIKTVPDGFAHFIRLPDDHRQAESAVRRFRTDKEMPFGVLAEQQTRDQSPEERAAALDRVGETGAQRRAVHTGAERPATEAERAANANGVRAATEETPAAPAGEDTRTIVQQEVAAAMQPLVQEFRQALQGLAPQPAPPQQPANQDALLEQLAEQAGVAPVVLKQALQNQARDVLAEPDAQEWETQRQQEATAEADAQAAVAAATGGDLGPVAEVVEVPPPEIPDGRKPWQVLKMGRNQWYAWRKRDPVEANAAVAAKLNEEAGGGDEEEGRGEEAHEEEAHEEAGHEAG